MQQSQAVAYATEIVAVAHASHAALLRDDTTGATVLLLGEVHGLVPCGTLPPTHPTELRTRTAQLRLLAAVHLSPHRPQEVEVLVERMTETGIGCGGRGNVLLDTLSPLVLVGAVDSVRYTAADHRPLIAMNWADSCVRHADMHTFRLPPRVRAARTRSIKELQARVARWPGSFVHKNETHALVEALAAETRRTTSLLTTFSTHADTGFLVELLQRVHTGGMVILAAGAAHTYCVAAVLRSVFGFTQLSHPGVAWVMGNDWWSAYTVRVLLQGRQYVRQPDVSSSSASRVSPRVLPMYGPRLRMLLDRLEPRMANWATASNLLACVTRARASMRECVDIPPHPRCNWYIVLNVALRTLRAVRAAWCAHTPRSACHGRLARAAGELFADLCAVRNQCLRITSASTETFRYERNTPSQRLQFWLWPRDMVRVPADWLLQLEDLRALFEPLAQTVRAATKRKRVQPRPFNTVTKKPRRAVVADAA